MIKLLKEVNAERLTELKQMLEQEKSSASPSLKYIDDLRLSIFRLENGTDVGFQSLVA